jgi:membrane complex biogenesis BtpA family protein
MPYADFPLLIQPVTNPAGRSGPDYLRVGDDIQAEGRLDSVSHCDLLVVVAIQLSDLFNTRRKPVIGMLHVPALPGSPQNKLGFDALVDWVLRDAKALAGGGIDALILENFGDVPFHPHRVPPHTVAFMAVLAREVRLYLDLPLGINVLRNDSASALAIAAAVAAEFIRVNIYTGARLTDQGVIQGVAHRLLRYRKLLGCDVKIFADVDVKHSAPLAARELSEEVEETVSRGCADGIIVTGSATGKQTALEDLKRATASARGTPVLAGSGVDLMNVAAVLAVADGLIVGTAFKRDGVSTNPVDSERVRAFMEAVRNRRVD